MKRGMPGRLERNSLTSEAYYNFIPTSLPPVPEINLGEIAEALEIAGRAIGALNATVTPAINPDLVIYSYVRKEALVSAQIEGTQSTLDDLLSHEMQGECALVTTPDNDGEEASTYTTALKYGLMRVAGGFPLSLRLIREMHAFLLSQSRGLDKSPGDFRRSQNWIGGSRPGNARFVPPPPNRLPELLGDLERFIHADDHLPLLVKAALIHVQFETIHPFLDGNGRMGRLLITLFLCVTNCLESPLLYLSLFFKENRDLYYEKLAAVRVTGDWEDWVRFFLEGVTVTAKDARETMLAIQRLFSEDQAKVLTLKRAAPSALVVYEEFQKQPILDVACLCRRTGKTKPTVIGSIRHLMDLGVVECGSEKKWGRRYAYENYIALLRPGTDPL